MFCRYVVFLIFVCPFTLAVALPPALPQGAPTQLKCQIHTYVSHQVPVPDSPYTRSVGYKADRNIEIPIGGDYVQLEGGQYYYYRFADKTLDVRSLVSQTELHVVARPAEAITLRDVYLASMDKRLLAVSDKPAKKSCPVSCSMKEILDGVVSGMEEASLAYLEKTRLSDLAARIPRRSKLHFGPFFRSETEKSGSAAKKRSG